MRQCAFFRYKVRMKYDALGLLVFVLGALLAQRLTLWLGPIWLSMRERRLGELRGGASERYFEERRSLEERAPRRGNIVWIAVVAYIAVTVIKRVTAALL